MGRIKQVTDPKEGSLDGVTADIKCVITQFDKGKQKGKSDGTVQKVIKSQSVIPCHILCAYSNGTVGFSMRQLDLMLTVRLDELMEILRAAAEANQLLQASMPKEYADAELEARWQEMADVEFVEADSPSGLILAKKWWVFPQGVDKGDILQYFDEHYSKGVAHLILEGAETKKRGG